MAEETAQIYKKKQRRKLLVVAAVVILLVAAAGAGVGLRWLQTRNSQQDVSEPAPTLSDSATELQDLRSEGDEAAFNERIAEALADQSLDDKTRYQVLLQQGHAFLDKQEFQQAIDTYLRAEQVMVTLEVTELLANAHRQAGDTAKAAEYYRKAITLIPDDQPNSASLKELFENIIKEIEGQ